MKTTIRLTLSALGLVLASTSILGAQTREAATVDDATGVLGAMMSIPARGIPESLLADAQGIVIIPDLLKGGFVLGVRYGRGIVVVRDDGKVLLKAQRRTSSWSSRREIASAGS